MRGGHRRAHHDGMTLDPPGQYADDRNLAARQRLWSQQQPRFDITGWVLDLAGARPSDTVLDVGCGNGFYLRALAARGVTALGCDLSFGMLRAAQPHPLLCNGDVTALAIRDAACGIVLAPHMLYHVTDRGAAARELRRVLRPGGVCVAITNGAGHMGSLRALVEQAVHVTNPGWEMRNPSTHVFSLENGGAQLSVAFTTVTCVPMEGAAPVIVPRRGDRGRLRRERRRSLRARGRSTVAGDRRRRPRGGTARDRRRRVVHGAGRDRRVRVPLSPNARGGMVTVTG